MNTCSAKGKNADVGVAYCMSHGRIAVEDRIDNCNITDSANDVNDANRACVAAAWAWACFVATSRFGTPTFRLGAGRQAGLHRRNKGDGEGEGKAKGAGAGVQGGKCVTEQTSTRKQTRQL